MASVHDVAAYILAQQGETTAMKLQKLCYYAQGHHLAWDGVPLFPEPIEAWANGPVSHDLFEAHRGRFTLRGGDLPGDPDALTADERATVDAVLDAYGPLSGHQMSVMVHREPPWTEARAGLAPGEPGRRPLDLESMQQYFGGLVSAEQAGTADG
jgi:uncharacterized phage-associated protein